MLEGIPNYPQTFMDRHMNWHMGGRAFPQGQPGSGADFLDFHHQFIADVKTWYATQPGHDLSKLEAWTHFPKDLVEAHPTLVEFENRASDGSMFTSEDALGIYIEDVHNSVHGWIADLYSEPEFGGFDSCKFFMFYQWHGMIDTWRGHWLSTHKRALKDFVDAGGQVPKIREVPKAIQDVLKHVVKEVVDSHHPKIDVPKNPKELVEVPGNGPIPDPAVGHLAQRLAQLEAVVHRQAFIRGEERPKVG